MSGRRFMLAAIAIAGVVALLMLTRGSSSQTSGETGSPESLSTQVAPCPTASSSDHHWLLVSWAMGYGDIPSLTGDADLVALGKITGCPSVVSEEVGAPPVTSTLYTSYFSFEIESVLHGATSQSTIVVVQMGGIVGGKTVEVFDDPLMQPGDRYVLFLREATAGRYAILGLGARFVVQDERVSSLSSVYPDRGLSDTGIRDVALGAFLEQVRQ